MKKIMKIILFFTLLIVSTLFVIYTAFVQEEKYRKFPNYDYLVVNFSKELLDKDSIVKIINIARENNVITSKTIYNGNRKNVYLNFNDEKQLTGFIGNIFKIKNKDCINCYASTKDKNAYLIADIFDNSDYNYYLFEKLVEDNGYLYGDYIIYYQNTNDVNNFFSEVNDVFQIDRGALVPPISGITTVSSDLFLLIVLVFILIQCVFYYIFQIYSLYHQSKKIGCMKLLGLSNFKIYKNLILKDSWIQLLFVPVITILSLFVKNITIDTVLMVFAINLLILFLLNFISYLSVERISKAYSIINIIKKQNIAKAINKINIILKIIFATVIIILTCFFSENIKDAYKQLKEVERTKYLSNYAVFSYVHRDDPDDYLVLNNLYQKLENNNISMIYADFSRYQYLVSTNSLYNNEKNDETSFASVDKGYLKKNDINIYDSDGKIVNIDDLNKMSLIFPNSKRNKVKDFLDYYISQYKQDYEIYNYPIEFDIYFYNDQKIPTYSLEEKLEYVENPIIRLVMSDFPIPYRKTPAGLSIAGVGMETSLKIDISAGKDEGYEVIEKYIKELGLGETIDKECFISYDEYLSDNLQYAYKVLYIVGLIILVIFLVYLFVIFQTVYIYIKNTENEIIVKKILGFNFKKIYEDIIWNNILFTLISIIIALICSVILGIFNFYLFTISSLMFVFIDLIMFILFIRLKKINLNIINEKLLKR